VRVRLGQLVEQPCHVAVGIRVMRQVPSAAQFLLDVVEALDVGHANAVIDVRYRPAEQHRRQGRQFRYNGGSPCSNGPSPARAPASAWTNGGADPHPRQPAPMLLQRAASMVPVLDLDGLERC
jgi:hypothetical protein